MKKVLKSLVLVFTLALVFVLAACGGGNNTTTSSTNQKTKVEAVSATCTSEGHIEYYTDAEGTYKLEADGTYTSITLEDTKIAALGHSPAEAVRENEVTATCMEAGSYDSVVYCERCQTETSRETTTVAKLDHVIEHVEAKAANAETLESGNIEYYHCTLCDNYFHDEEGTEIYENKNDVIVQAFSSMEELLQRLPFEDVHIPYDGERHQIKYEGPRPSGVRITCTPATTYYKVGEYQYTLKVIYNGETSYKYATMSIEKWHPEYLGETEYIVYLNDPSTQPHFEFNYENVPVINEPLYTEPGDYTYTLKTKETDLFTAIEPVEITYHVYQSKTGYKFEGASFVANGDEVGIYLTHSNPSYELPAGYTVTYNNNTATTQGIYKATATIKDENDQVYETFRAILTVDWPENAAFEEYVTQIFKDYIEGDQLTLNIFTVDYEAMGLEHGDALWYSFDGYDDYTLEDFAHDQEEIANERQIFEAFGNEHLSYGQLVSYNRIDEFLTLYERILADYEYNFIAITYVDQYGGYAADFPTDMEAYQLRTKQDIEDYISYFASTADAFDSYYDFIVAKAERGYGYSKFTLEEYAKYLKGVVDAYNGYNGYYLVRVAMEKLEAAKTALALTDEEYQDYHDRLYAAANTTLKEAHESLYNKVTNFLATETYFNAKDFTGAYLGNSKKGQEYYYTILSNRLGTFDMSSSEYLESLQGFLDQYYKLYKAHSSNSSIGSDISDGKVKIFDYGDDILSTFTYLKEFARTIVPDLTTNPTIDVTWMDPTVTENTTTMAYYMKSPLDSYDKEYIHLNGRQLESDDSSNYELMATIAHEGYPGHLYAYVNTKENSSLSNFVRMATYSGHGEGWAKYVENRFAYYVASLHEGEDDYDQYVQFADYTTAWETFVYLIYARADYGINYEGWNATKVGSWAKTYGLSFNDPTDFYNTLNDNPSTYPSYGYGLAVFLDLHDQARAALGNYYDEVEFNGFLLSHGWCSLDSLREYVADYIDQYNFLLGKDAN